MRLIVRTHLGRSRGTRTGRRLFMLELLGQLVYNEVSVDPSNVAPHLNRQAPCLLQGQVLLWMLHRNINEGLTS